MNRRDFLKTATVAAGAGVVGVGVPGAGAAVGRPGIPNDAFDSGGERLRPMRTCGAIEPWLAGTAAVLVGRPRRAVEVMSALLADRCVGLAARHGLVWVSGDTEDVACCNAELGIRYGEYLCPTSNVIADLLRRDLGDGDVVVLDLVPSYVDAVALSIRERLRELGGPGTGPRVLYVTEGPTEGWLAHAVEAVYSTSPHADGGYVLRCDKNRWGDLWGPFRWCFERGEVWWPASPGGPA